MNLAASEVISCLINLPRQKLYFPVFAAPVFLDKIWFNDNLS